MSLSKACYNALATGGLTKTRAYVVELRVDLCVLIPAESEEVILQVFITVDGVFLCIIVADEGK